MKKHIRILGFAVAAIGMSTSFGWGDMGHSTVGYIAEKMLKEENSVEARRAQRLVYEILGGEPLAHAAIWPDAMRSDSRYSPFDNYHFVTLQEGKRFAELPSALQNKYSAHTLLTKGLDQIRNKKLSVHQRAVLLRYFTHLVGDVHQPLHVGNPYDRGGNKCDIYPTESAQRSKRSSNLHSFIDTGIFEGIKDRVMRDHAEAVKKEREAAKAENREPKLQSIGYFSYVHMGDALVNEAKAQPEQWAELVKRAQITDRGAWYDESHALHAVVYPDGPSPLPALQRAYCKLENVPPGEEAAKYDPAKIPLLDEAYFTRAVPVVKSQVILSGLRLANELKRLAVRMKFHPMTEADQKAFFKPLLIDFQPKCEGASCGRDPASHSEDSGHWCEDH